MKNENKCDFCIAHLAKICDVDETKEQCLIFQEILNQKLQLALTEQQTKIQNMQIMPGTCKPVPMSKCLSKQLYVDNACPQHGRTI